MAKAMAADQRQKELAFPWIGQGELELHRWPRCGGKLGMEAFERTPRRLHFALRLGGFEQGLNLADFIDEFVAGHGGRKVKGTTGWAATTKSKPASQESAQRYPDRCGRRQRVQVSSETIRTLKNLQILPEFGKSIVG
jgi:hypothetical protein